MKQELLGKLFSSLQSLEKCVEKSWLMFETQRDQPQTARDALAQQEQILKHMRRVLNKLQLELAKDNWSEASRYVKIYYGLQQMVHTEIMYTFSTLSNEKVVLQFVDSGLVPH